MKIKYATDCVVCGKHLAVGVEANLRKINREWTALCNMCGAGMHWRDQERGLKVLEIFRGGSDEQIAEFSDNDWAILKQWVPLEVRAYRTGN
jgi:hypothetical protein